jgi:hypothetical protein
VRTIELRDGGWCVYFLSRQGCHGIDCRVLVGRGMLCVPCAARDAGLPADADEEAVRAATQAQLDAWRAAA